jgi:hypothetical protein
MNVMCCSLAGPAVASKGYSGSLHASSDTWPGRGVEGVGTGGGEAVARRRQPPPQLAPAAAAPRGPRATAAAAAAQGRTLEHIA